MDFPRLPLREHVADVTLQPSDSPSLARGFDRTERLGAMRGGKQSPFLGKRVALVENGVPLLYPRYNCTAETPKGAITNVAKSKRKREKRKATYVEDTEGGSAAGSEAVPSRDVCKDVGHVEQKRQKREVRTQGSGDGNASEAMGMRQILGITPPGFSENDGKPTSRGFSFGFQAYGIPEHVEVPTTSNSGEKLDIGEEIDTDKERSAGRRKVYAGGMPYGLSEEEVVEFWSECGEVESVDCLVFPDTNKFRGIAFVTFSTVEGYQQALLSDGEMVDGFELKVKPWTDKANETPVEASNEQGNSQEGLDILGEKSEGYNVAFVCNVPYEVTKEDLHELFLEVGVDYVRLHTKVDSDESRGFAHVHFKDGESLDKAIAMDGMTLKGRVIRIGYAKPKTQAAADTPGLGSPKSRELEIDLDGIPAGCGDVGSKHPRVHAIHLFNLPFTATRRDFDRLFEGCTIKKVLLPLDSTKNANAGVAVVEFADAKSCEEATKVNGGKFGGREIKLRYAKSREVNKFRFLISKDRKDTDSKKRKKTRKKSVDIQHMPSMEGDDPLMGLL